MQPGKRSRFLFLSALHILHTLIFIVSLRVPGFNTLRYLILLYWTFSYLQVVLSSQVNYCN